MPIDYEAALAASVAYFEGDELAAKVFVDKYALRDDAGALLEATPADMHRRVAREFARVEVGKFAEPLSEDEIFAAVEGYKRIIPQGSSLYGIGNPYQHVTVGNCYVVPSVEDSYGGILRTDQHLVQISKRRGGVGVDLSNLRPAGTRTRNAARSSTGVVTFMKRFSNSIREVGQEGRRGALMMTLSVHHPEVLEFAAAKKNVADVTGANISIRYTDEFLNAVKLGTDYEQRWPVEGAPKVRRMVDARSVWRTVVGLAWEFAEPGVLFWDRITSESPADCYPGFKTISTNPCLPSWAKLLTKAGARPLSEIGPGDEVWSGDGWVGVTAKWSTGLNEVYEAKTAVGSFHGTALHGVFEEGEPTRLVDARAIDALAAPGDEGPARTTHKTRPLVLRSVEETFGLSVDGPSRSFWCDGFNASNCGEIPQSVDSCRLLLLNLAAYVRDPYLPTARFDREFFRSDAMLAQRLMDDLVDIELEKIDAILAKVDADPEDDETKAVERSMWTNFRSSCEQGRRTGTGITGLGDFLAGLNLKYGSDESIAVAEDVYRELKLACYRSSVEMARELDPFPAWDPVLEKDNPFLLRIKDEDPVLYEDMNRHGRRNIALLTTAPAGTVSTQSQTTSGIEPAFMLSYVRRKKVNPNDAGAKVDFVDQSGDAWQEFVVHHHGVEKWMRATGESDVAKGPYFGATANEIDWRQRVKLQAAANRHIDHAISSTINLPNDVSVEKVAEIFETAWEAGAKGVTVYRDGCRTGVLVDKGAGPVVSRTTAAKRPRDLPADVHHVTAAGKKLTIVVGLVGDAPYEVFGAECVLPRSVVGGTMRKAGKGRYDLLSPTGEVALEDVTQYCGEDAEAVFRLASTSLRHGADVRFVVEQLEKVRGTLHGLAKGVVRVLKKYVPDGTASKEPCGECGKAALVRSEGCVRCVECGWSRC